MEKVVIRGYYRNEILHQILDEEYFRKQHGDIPANYEIYNIKIKKTGKKFVKESDDMGPNWSVTIHEYEITVTYKKE